MERLRQKREETITRAEFVRSSSEHWEQEDLQWQEIRQRMWAQVQGGLWIGGRTNGFCFLREVWGEDSNLKYRKEGYGWFEARTPHGVAGGNWGRIAGHHGVPGCGLLGAGGGSEFKVKPINRVNCMVFCQQHSTVTKEAEDRQVISSTKIGVLASQVCQRKGELGGGGWLQCWALES